MTKAIRVTSFDDLELPQSRLFVVSGKGGTGKTSFSLALALALSQQGKKVIFHSFQSEPTTSEACHHLNIEELKLSARESAELYIQKKLGSKMIAHWILKTPFFDALLGMLPGLESMILFGNLLEELWNDPELYMVVDSPSSGHALTMFQSSYNFKEIFSTGAIFEDIKKIHNWMEESENLSTILLAHPTQFSLQEAEETASKMNSFGLGKPLVFINDCYAIREDFQNQEDSLPDYFRKKVMTEKEVLNSLDMSLKGFPHFSTESVEETALAFFTQGNEK